MRSNLENRSSWMFGYSAYVDLRNATPDDFKSVWDGQRKCGSVCAGANKYIPPGVTTGCKTTIQICSQDIDVGSMSESDIKASCELNAGMVRRSEEVEVEEEVVEVEVETPKKKSYPSLILELILSRTSQIV